LPGIIHIGAEEHVAVNRNARLGLIFFCVYAAIYFAFVLGNAYAPKMMELTPIAGINLAVLGGLALIGLAFVMALAFGILCRKSEELGDSKDRSGRT
jgi:uncharacterized membrane protein (DUF485 family)